MESEKLTLYATGSALTVALNIIAVSTVWWMHVKGTGDIGAFTTQDNGGNPYHTVCPSMMSELVCGYLKSVQVSAVVTVIFGIVATMLYLVPFRAFSSYQTFVAVSGNACQLTFAIMTAVLFLYFKNQYYDDDGINREYPAPDADSLTYDTSYYIWCGSALITTVVVGLGYFELFQRRRKNPYSVQ
ncbi:hypothetical protein B484DRAFT_444289 [Ochromonadaceae sp. CCMP2298]|nr:hypothetical protein B484DRAFT_444289 [Ochromonadaceae sp. CCMP2298]|mmetsp:Transcript_18768/g.41798  ORF Transcript_18768/g.41798 Transcript_18768/m.41798 type:complete len:186 (+) Transcript_18768:95-652(+)